MCTHAHTHALSRIPSSALIPFLGALGSPINPFKQKRAPSLILGYWATELFICTRDENASPCVWARHCAAADGLNRSFPESPAPIHRNPLPLRGSVTPEP